MIALFIGVVVLSLIVGIGGCIWRANMAMNEPEKYERLLKYEEDVREHFSRAYKPFTPAAKKGAALGTKLLIRILTKRR